MARVKQTLRAAEPEKKKKADAAPVEALKRTRAKKADEEVVKKTRTEETAKKTRTKKADQEPAKKTHAEEAVKKPRAKKEAAKPAKAKKTGAGGIRRPHRWHPGTVAKRESARLRKTMGTTLVLQRGPFRDLVRASLGEGVAPVTAEAYRAIQSLVEDRALFVLDVARVLLESGKRSTLSAADIDRAIDLTRHAQTFLNEY